MSTNPIVVAITALLAEAAAVAVGFGVINNTQAGLAVSLGSGVVLLGAAIYAAVAQHSAATVRAAQIHASAVMASSSPPAGK